MRQIVLGTSLASAGAVASNTTMKSLGFVYRDHANADALKFSLTSSDFAEDFFQLVLKRANADGGDLVVPFHKNKLTFSKAVFAAGSAATGTLNLSAITVTPGHDYTVIFCLKGVQFNERNKWTCTVRATDTDDAESIANKIADYVNANTANLGLTAVKGTSTDAGKITLTATEKGKSYVCVTADDLAGVSNLNLTFAWYNSGNKVPDVAKYIADLVSKAAADAGFEYTRNDNDIYPAFFGNPGIDLSAYASGAIVYTFAFAEPRLVKTTDDVVRQVVQVVLPSSVTVTSFDTLCAALGSQIK